MIRTGGYYLLNNDISKKYYLDQLVSKTTGAFITVMSVPSSYHPVNSDSGTYVVGMSFNVKSLKQMILPTGFQFALMDYSGKVLYHSDSARNLNENLLNEFSENEKLKSLMEASAAGHLITGYLFCDYYVFVKPVKDLPYFIVMFEDAAVKETRETEFYSFTFSCMLFFFGFIVIQMMVTFIVSSKKSFFKKTGL
ncbi:hypothetical protein BH10BAC3_BH10BAC3_31560 [soil metagenome]